MYINMIMNITISEEVVLSKHILDSSTKVDMKFLG